MPTKIASQSMIYTTILPSFSKSKGKNISVIKKGRMTSPKLGVKSLVKIRKNLMEGRKNYLLK